MIVNPQLFNYRLIIGTLVIAIVVLGSISFSSYNTYKSQEAVAEQEFKLVQQELSEMISLYEGVGVENEDIALQLRHSKSRIHVLLDSLHLVKANLPLITKYKQEARALRESQNGVLAKLNSIKKENSKLQLESDKASETIALQKDQIEQLTVENQKLAIVVKEFTALSANNIQAKALITSRSNYDIETNNAEEANNLEVCFTLEENPFSPKGNKDIYVQILDQNNNVISDRGAVQFGQTSLVYSGKTSVNYRNSNIDVCTKINVNSKEPLKKGNYIISVFHDNEILGTSKIELN
ncbi:hypothetical protein [Hanstruepera marina]|uniref:hypothetical protein n=1 Tax=Hanstruepera marina TaxID=2873265 RepID=UPI001CA6875E|nr:hypothetical protein [Hanstruepera marina]